MANDLITILKEIRGTGAPEEEYTDGIYYDIVSKDYNGNPGLYGDIIEKHLEVINANLDMTSRVLESKAALDTYTTTDKYAQLDTYTSSKEGELTSHTDTKITELTDHVDTPVSGLKAQLTDYVENTTTGLEKQLDDFTDVKEGELDTYRTATVQPAIDTYRTGTVEPAVDSYRATTVEPALDTYRSTIVEPALDSYRTGTVEPALDTYRTGTVEPAIELYRTGTVEPAFDAHAVGKTTDFDNNAATKTTAYDDNHTAKVAAYDANDVAKLGEYNSNHTTKLAAIQGVLDNFQDQYLGSHADNTSAEAFAGAELGNGDLYWNSTSNEIRFYTGSGWEAPEAVASAAATTATTQASTATAQAGIATTKADEASLDAAQVAADLVQTNQDTIDTAADLVATNADAAQTNLDKIATAADRVQTGLDRAAVAAIYDTFDDRYLGSFAEPPTLDNDGNTLQSGAIYFNTVADLLSVYDVTWHEIPNMSMAALSDVTLTSVTTGDILTWDGVKWVNTSTPIVDSIQFNGGADTQGTVSWNVDEETLDVILNGATLQLGQETQIHCRNNSGATITNGTVVMATGTLGASGRITIAPYDGTSPVKYILGVAAVDILNDADGKVTNLGKVRGIDTSTWLEGDILYAAADGALTKVEPATGVHAELAMVINVHATNGTIMVRFTPIDRHLFEPADTTILKDDDIGSTVQAYDADTVSDGSYVHTDNNYTTTEKTKVGFISVTQAVDLDTMEEDISSLSTNKLDASSYTSDDIISKINADTDFTIDLGGL